MSLRQGVPTAGSVPAAGSRASSRAYLTGQSRVAAWIERYIHYVLVAPSVLAGFNFRFIFNARSGLANQLLVQFGPGLPLAWLADANLSRLAIVVVTVWQGMPFMLLLLLAGLQALPTSPFEAATVDGASAWQRFWYITLPLLRPVIVVA